MVHGSKCMVRLVVNVLLGAEACEVDLTNSKFDLAPFVAFCNRT